MVLFVYAGVGLRSLLQFGVHALVAARRFRAVALAMFLQSFCANVSAASVAGITHRLDLALLAYWCAQVAVVSLASLYARDLFPRGHWERPRLETLRALLPHGFKIQLGEWAQIVTFQFDKFIIANWLGLVSVAPYEVANRSLLALRSIPSSGLDSFLPSAAIGQADPGDTWERYLLVTRLAASAIVLFMLAPLAIAPLFLYAWTGAVGYQSQPVFVALFLGFAANVLAIPAAAMAQASGRAELQARAAIAAMLVNVPLSVVLLLQWGMAGAAFGTSVAMVCGAALLLAGVHRAYGRSLRPTLALLLAYWPVLLSGVLLALLVQIAFGRWWPTVAVEARDAWQTRLPVAVVALLAFLASASLLLALQIRLRLVSREQYEQLAHWLQERWSISLPGLRRAGRER